MFRSIDAGYNHTCVGFRGALYCWGDNTFGQLGIGMVGGTFSAPRQVMGVSSFTSGSVGLGELHTVVAGTSAGTQVWGSNDRGQLGTGAAGGSFASPLTISPTSMTGIRAGAQHSCWSNASAFQCWGRNDQGQLGLGSAGPDVLSPTTVTGGTPLSFSLGEAHTCFIAATNQLFCFGANSSGQLGIGAISTPVLTPTQEATGSSSWLLVDAGGSHTCAIGRGTLYCWGSNAAGQLGLGGTMDVSTPMLVGGDRSWTVISAGRSHTCGLQGAGQLWC
jgi:alpha-tubulin suppressor-like RCC1 family protein